MRTLVILLCCLILPVSAADCDNWPQWQAYRQHFISSDGRVIDRSSHHSLTTSEGQSYGLFFALVANDQPAFAQLLAWTQNNLAEGDLSTHLPAWAWGQQPDGRWGVLDKNSAADADLWIAYSLLEAGRLWQQPRYLTQGKQLAARIWQEETASLPGLGRMLLPAPYGFQPEAARWRLNPSYLPLQILARLAQLLPENDWHSLHHNTQRLLQESAPHGFAPDWVVYTAKQGFTPDSQTQASGSYDAIRVYLWAGMLSAQADGQAALLHTLAPMTQWLSQHDAPPRQIDTRSGQMEGDGPVGFSAALLPLLQSSGAQAALQQQLARLNALPLSQRPDNYYDHVLTLFGLGWQQGRYRFGSQGQLQTRWDSACR
ncbi:cellulose synthase complex periplasmic endoglucanase BcsZ [Neisseriaceae bacterium TC5R-5]|nr:cellulose synthase complex periplasmic endoglucanase BcsZ [Neisseriaceae bacterium TC5R-5]